MTNLNGTKVVVRGIDSGVFFGTLIDRNGQEVELHNCRNIWDWEGAANLNQIAVDGIGNLEHSRISMMAVDIMTLTDICEIIPLSEKAINNLEGARPWRV